MLIVTKKKKQKTKNKQGSTISLEDSIGKTAGGDRIDPPVFLELVKVKTKSILNRTDFFLLITDVICS